MARRSSLHALLRDRQRHLARLLKPWPVLRVGTIPACRDLRFERLESRQLLAADSGFRGHVFYDQNTDQLRNSNESGLSGWRIYLDLNDDKSLNDNEPVAYSDASGAYEILGDYSGFYVVREELRPGWIQTAPSDGYRVGLTVGQIREDLDFGNIVEDPALFGSIQGTVWNDGDASATQESSESGIQYWELYLDANNNQKLDMGEQWVLTELDGSYRFEQLPPVHYSVRQVQGKGWTATTPVPDFYSIDLQESQQFDNANFGNRLESPGMIRGSKWIDVNGNGLRDTEEQPQADIRIYLDDNVNGVWDAHEPSALTDELGQYTFPFVAPGSHVVAEVTPPKWRQNAPGVDHGFDPAELLGFPSDIFTDAGSLASLTVGTFAGNSLPDPALLDPQNHRVVIQPNAGQGHLLPPIDVTLDADVNFILTADLDGDQDTDLLSISNILDNVQQTRRARIDTWRNAGDGQFSKGAVNWVDGNIDAATVVDVQADGRIDLFLTRRMDDNSLSSSPLLLSSNAQGAFTPLTDAVLPNIDRGPMVIRDLNQDGFPDLMVLNANQNALIVKMNQQDGTFSAGTSYTVGISPTFITAGDIDGDQDWDLVVSNSFGNDLSILRNQGSGTFGNEQRIGPVSGPGATALIDIDDDQNLDLLVLSGIGNTLITFSNNGSGTFTFAGSLAVGRQPRELLVGDWDNDGWMDLAIGNQGSNEISVVRNLGTGSLTITQTIAIGTRINDLITGNVNDDSLLDLIVRTTDPFGDPRVGSFVNQGNGTFATDNDLPLGPQESTLSADFDGDGTADLLRFNQNQNFLPFWINGGAGVFRAEQRVGLIARPRLVRAIDLNGDQIADLVVQFHGTNSLSVYLNSGNGTFASTGSLSPGHPIHDWLGTDLNEDGSTDLLFTSPADQVWWYLPGRGNGQFSDPLAFTMPVAGSMAVGDLDGDRHSDLLFELVSGNLGLVLNQTDPAYRHRVQVTPDGVVTGADFGNQRYIWTNPANPLDVDASGFVVPLDALLVINYLNRFGGGDLAESLAFQTPYLDTAGGDNVTPFDALVVINHLNHRPSPSGGEGESALGTFAIDLPLTFPTVPQARTATSVSAAQHSANAPTINQDSPREYLFRQLAERPATMADGFATQPITQRLAWLEDLLAELSQDLDSP
ncbi:MAG: hypothetical protein RIS70_2748 [Planctomycetota bacterium]